MMDIQCWTQKKKKLFEKDLVNIVESNDKDLFINEKSRDILALFINSAIDVIIHNNFSDIRTLEFLLEYF